MQLCSSLNFLWHFPSLGLEWKLAFSNPVATAEFSKFSDILTASSFSIFNGSAGIPSLPLALFVVMFPQAHLTSHYSSRWVTAPLWFSGSLKPFLYSSSVYSCHLFSIPSASVRSLLFLSFTVPILAGNTPLISQIFLKRFLVFPILLFSSISLHCLFKKALLSLLAVLWNSALTWVYLSFSPLPFASFLSSAICKASSGNHFAFLHFFPFEMVLVTASSAVLSYSIVTDSLRPHGLQPTRIFCPWNFSGKNTGVGCHCLLQRIFPTQGWKWCLLGLLHGQADSSPLGQVGSPTPCCTMLQTSILGLQALCLLDLFLWIYFSSLLYNHKGFDLGHTWMA